MTVASIYLQHSLGPTGLNRSILAATGAKVIEGGEDGENLLPLLRQNGKLKRDAIYFHYPNYAFHKQNRLGAAIRTGNHKLIHWYDDHSVELYDLSEDIGEQQNLASEDSKLADQLNEKLADWLKESGAKMPTRVP